MDVIGIIIFDIFAMLVTLGILVTFHEFGHFWVARKCGVRVEKFSIGFGKPLISWFEKEPTVPGQPPTQFVIAALPLGGYVKMLGEQEQEVPAELKKFAFNQKPLHQRAAIVAAGPVANFLLAIVLYWFMFMNGVSDFAPVVGKILPDSVSAQAGLAYGDEIIAVDGKDTQTWQEVRKKLLDRLGESGTLFLEVRKADSTLNQRLNIPLNAWLHGEKEPDVLGSLGITPIYMDIPPKLGQLEDGGRAQSAGLATGDLILSANGTGISSWEQWVNLIRQNPEADMQVDFERNDAIMSTVLRPAVRLDENGLPQLSEDGREQGYIGAGVELPVLSQDMIRHISYSPFSALTQAVRETWDNSVFVLVAIKKMIVGLMSVNNISGPLTIAQIAGDTASDGLEYFVGFLAILSISLGVMNLLPIPVLDGGHLFYYAIEAITRRPLPESIQEIGLRLGILVIAGIMFIAFYNDLNRLF